MNFLNEALSFIFTAANWGGPAGLAARILEHLQYTVVAVFFSALIAIPLGMLIGHTGRGTFIVVTGVNALRALPTLGVLLLGVLLWGLGLVPPTVALMLLGIPPAWYKSLAYRSRSCNAMIRSLASSTAFSMVAFWAASTASETCIRCESSCTWSKSLRVGARR